jgi:hypothetical protein
LKNFKTFYITYAYNYSSFIKKGVIAYMKGKKINMIVGILLISLIVPTLNANVQAQQEPNQNDMLSFHYINDNELLITFHLPELIETHIKTSIGSFLQFTIPNAGFIGAIGAPQLPAITKMVAVPTQQYSLEVINAHLKETRYVEKIYPMQNPQSDDETSQENTFVYNLSAYQQDTLLPGDTIDIVNNGNIRDIPFIKVQFLPLQYNPSQGIAMIYDTIVIKLTFSPTASVTVEPNFTQKEFYPYYENVFTNWQEFEENTRFQQQNGIKETGCDYLIITHQNYYTQAQQLAEWKHQTGYMTKTINVSEIGTTYQQIRQFLITAYSSWTPRPSYVVLLGDAEYIPTTYINGVPTDLWYAAVDGSDYYPDLFIGRIPADSANQAAVMIQKIITYEQTPPTLPSFYNNFVAAAYFQDDNTNGYEDRRFVLTSEEIRDYLLSQGYNGERIYCTDSYVNPTHYNNDYYANGEPLPSELLRPGFAWDGDAADISTAINNGIFILNHRDHGMESGWGDPYFTTNDFNSFSNGELLPVVFSINCLTGKFDTTECFCEELLRKQDGGAVAVYGATDVSYSGYNDYLCRGFYDAIWPAFDPEIGNNISLYHLGEILNYGKAFMADTWGDPWGYEEYEFELFHIFGDPSLDLYTSLPQTLQVTYTPSDMIQITVLGNGSAVEGAHVCLRQENGFYRAGYTDENGDIEFNTTGATIDQAISCVATAHNYLYCTDSFMLNQRPQTPDRPTGSIEGKPNVEYIYKSSTIDADEDMVFYNFSWGDGNYSGWIGPFASGVEAFARHAWTTKGTYNITVKAKDIKGDESDWSEPLAITMPLKISYDHPILQMIYQLFMNRFNFFSTVFEALSGSLPEFFK